MLIEFVKRHIHTIHIQNQTIFDKCHEDNEMYDNININWNLILNLKILNQYNIVVYL